MASFSFANQLSFFLFFLVLLFSPQIQARDSKFFSLFNHFKTIYNVKDESLAPTLAPAPAPVTEEPAAAPENGETIPSGPAPGPEFFDKGEGYGLYGSDSSSQQYSQTKETPKTSTFEDELLNEDFNDNKSYKTGYPQTNLYNYHNNEVYTTKNYNNEQSKNTYNNNEVNSKKYNSEEYKNNYNNEVYSKKYNSEEYKNNYNNEVYSNNFNDNNGKEYYYNNNNNNNNNYGNGYEKKGDQGMSDTRFMENGKYYYNVNGENENNYNLNGYESSERGSTENSEGYYQKNQYPNEFDTMEEYEKQQQAQGYTP